MKKYVQEIFIIKYSEIISRHKTLLNNLVIIKNFNLNIKCLLSFFRITFLLKKNSKFFILFSVYAKFRIKEIFYIFFLKFPFPRK